jgi:hypothetical protein
MKTINKHSIWIVLVLMIAQKGNSQRNTIWVYGASQTSKSWVDFRQEMSWRGYNFTNLLDNNTEPAGNGILPFAAYLDQRVNDKVQTLGIAHGYGGIALRYAQHLNPNIEAMILCGVPNQGSWAIHKATFSFPGQQTELQKMVESVESIKQGDNCMDCNVTGIFKNWINSLEAGKDYLGDLSPESDIISNINEPNMMPSVPYLVLYSTVEEFSLTRMLDSRAWTNSNANYLTNCYWERIEEEVKRVNLMEVTTMLTLLSSFYKSSLNFVGTTISATSGSTPNPGQIINAAGNFVQETTNAIIKVIEDKLKIEQELARMLRCRLADQVLEAEWMLKMLDGQFVEEEVFVYNVLTQEHIDWCEADCEEQFPDANSYHHCLGYCFNDVGGFYQTITVFVPELNDGLLTETEQRLTSPLMAGEIHLPDTDHFQQTSRTKQVLTDAFESIFEGNFGAAFIVPKN